MEKLFAVGDEVAIFRTHGEAPLQIAKVERVQQFKRSTKITVGGMAFNSCGSAWEWTYHSPSIRHVEPGDSAAMAHERRVQKALGVTHRLTAEGLRKLTSADLDTLIRVLVLMVSP